MMSNQVSKIDSRKLADGLVVLARYAARSRYPNPQRVDCPSREVLAEMAQRSVRRDVSRKLPVVHVASCTECFREFEEERRRVKRQRMVLSAAAVGALAASLVIAFWVWSGEASKPSVQPPSQSQVAVVEPAPVSVVVDLAGHAVFRSDGEAPKPIVLPAKAVDLKLLLPVGAEPGTYSLLIRQGSQEYFRSGRMTESINKAVAISEVVDLRAAKPGPAQLILQRNGSSPRTYEAVILK